MFHRCTKPHVCAVLAACLLLPLLLTGCGKDKPSGSDTEPGTAAVDPAPTDTSGRDPDTSSPETADPETTISGGNTETDEPGPTETKPPEEEKPVVQLTGPYADSIMYADATKNEIQVYFADQLSRDVVIENRQMQMILNTMQTGQKQVTALKNKNGASYLENTMDVFIRTSDGRTLYASDSPAAGRLNIYRYGYYYYNTHILDQIFAAESYIKEFDLRADSIPRRGFESDIEYVDVDTGVAFRVTSTTDPYVGLSKLTAKAADYNAVEIVMRAQQASTADLFLGVGSHEWPNGDQHVAFAVSPGEAFHTYVIPIASVKDYTGTINSLRVDIGAAVGEVIEIQSLRLVKIDDTIPSITLDRTLHAYADKLTQETHLVTTAATENLAAYGMETKIPADTVAALIVKDKNGTHDSINGVDLATLEYIGLDIKGTGILGYIKPVEYGGQLTVTLSDGVYTIIQEVAAESGKEYKKDTHLYMATALYTDATHDFADFLYAAACERDPLTITVTNDADGGKFVGYDSLRGAYRLDINGTVGFQYNYENNIRRTLTFKVTGTDRDRKIYLYTYTGTGETLESAVLLDENNRLLPIPVEVCKNFGHEKEEPIFVPGDDRWGETYFPMVAEAGKDTTLSVVNLYQDWGRFPLKQISSISYFAPYYHLSTGATETNCIANYFISSMSNNLLPDFRGMSQRFWVNQPQHTAAGILNFLSYTNTDGKFIALRHEADAIKSDGPVYADIEMNYATHDGKLAVVLDHIEMPQTDENRTYYTYTVTVLEDLTIADFKKNFTLFTMSSTNTNYAKLGYLDENNSPVITNTSATSDLRCITLGSESPYVDFFLGDETVHEDGYTNLAVLFKSYAVTIDGKPYEGNLVLRESLTGGKNRADITLDLGDVPVTLKRGDTLVFEMILLPWGEGQDSGESENDDIVRRVRMDSCIEPFTIRASEGTVIDHPFIPMVMAEDGWAEFTVSGGHDTAVFYEGMRDNKNKVRGVAVRVFGFDTIGVPVVEEYVNARWVPVNLASDDYIYDGYSVRYEGDGTYSYAFAVDMTEPKGRRFRVTLNTDERIFAAVNPAIPGGGEPVGPDRPDIPDQPDKPDPSEIVIDGVTYTTNCINSLSKMSFDSLHKDTKGTLYQEKDGGATAYIQTHPITFDDTWECIRVRGWAGYDQPIVSYGYRINDGELITDTNFVNTAEQGVLDAGGQSRFTITAPLDTVTENTLFRAYIILEDGTAVEMIRFWALGATDSDA